MKKQKLYILAALLAALVLLCFVPRPAEAASLSEIQQQIDALEQQKAEVDKKLSTLQWQYDNNFSQAQDAVQQKDNIDQQISLLHEKITSTNSQISAYALLISDQQKALEEAQQRLSELNQKHKDRIRAIEEQGKLTYWSVLFEATSFQDFLDRFHMIQEIADADSRRLQELSEAAQEVARLQQDMQQEKDALQQTREQLLQDEALLEEKRAEADQVLQKLSLEVERFEALLQESENAQKNLMNQIANKENEYDKKAQEEWLATSQPGSAGASGWICPLPYYTLTSPFGMRFHPIDKVYRMHNGVDMAAAAMTPIYAARSGYVSIADYQAYGAGNYVKLNHGDGFSSIYMHMTSYVVRAGQRVDQGQLIGYVGTTGLSNGNHLHFGIAYNGEYVNPMKYID